MAPEPPAPAPPVHCPACAATSLAPLWPDLAMFRCSSCGLGLSTLAAPNELYEAPYFEGGEYVDYLAEEPALRTNFRRWLRWLRRWQASGRLLEIGCAYGYFLDVAREPYDVHGVEISRHAAEAARGRHGDAVTRGDYLDQPAPAQPWDVVCLWDTIEHLPRPAETLAKAARELRPGGVLALATGDFGSLLARWRGRRWRQIHPPTHLFYFTQAALERLFARLGLQVLDVRHPGFTRRYASVVGSLLRGTGTKSKDRPTRWRSAARALLTLGGRLDFSLYLNTRDYILIAGRKKSA